MHVRWHGFGGGMLTCFCLAGCLGGVGNGLISESPDPSVEGEGGGD